MKPNKPISDIWLKSAVLGCLWASSEIVLGSFLHNLRVPFASNFLTGIGIMLLVSVSYLWKDKGLFWRSGLICALMKSVSPSAIIFGPMIAIFFESVLLEISVMVFRRNIFAFLIGGMLAMSWTFAQKIATFIIVYGFNMVNLYKDLAKFAQKQLNMQFENIWTPVLVVWSIYLAMGIVAALMGVYIGKKASKRPALVHELKTDNPGMVKSMKQTDSLKPSLIWLFFNIMIMITVLCLMNFTDWIWWSTAGVIAITIWAIRYKRALRPLKKPKFWIIFIIITMLTSYLFSKFQPEVKDIYTGLMIGLQMNLRAAVMVIGFSVIGKELTNPVIRNFFIGTSVRQLPMALEVAFETLPFVIGNFPDFRKFFRKPVSVVSQIVSQADIWLERIMLKSIRRENIIFITGNVGQGKTTFLSSVAQVLNFQGIKAGGFLSPAVFDNGTKIGYDIIGLMNGERSVISRISGSNNMARAGKYYFYEEGLEFGNKALAIENNSNSQIIIIDEIGHLELENNGWAKAMNQLLIKTDIPLILVVRNQLIEKVMKKWCFERPLMIDISSNNTEQASIIITDFLHTINTKK